MLFRSESNRFETANFYGKKLIVITDSEQYTGDVSVLKKITGQDELRYEKKGVQQTSGFRFPGIVWLAANEAMQSKDYTSGLRRRRLSMPFNRVIPPHLRIDLEEVFKPFLPGLLAWVLEMPNSEVEEYVRNTDRKVKSLASYKEEVLLETIAYEAFEEGNLFMYQRWMSRRVEETLHDMDIDLNIKGKNSIIYDKICDKSFYFLVRKVSSTSYNEF